MKILKRTKGLLRFRTTEGTIVLKDGENELTDKEFELIKAHPMYEAMVGTSGLVIVAKEEKKSKVKDDSEDGIHLYHPDIDLSDIDLEAQDKKTLVEIANSLEIETKGLNAKQIIEKIKATK